MLKKILMGLGVIVALILLAAAFMSKEMKYEGSVTIDAPASAVWHYTSSLKGMDMWSPWSKKDPNATQTWTGEDGAIGSSNCWDSEMESVGKGCQTITESEENKHLGTDLKFEAPNESEADAYIDLVEKDGGTEVTWGFTSEIPWPFNIMMAGMDMDKLMGDDWNAGLSKLKELAEAKAKEDAAAAAAEAEMAAMAEMDGDESSEGDAEAAE